MNNKWQKKVIMSYFSAPQCLLKVCCNVPMLVTMTPTCLRKGRGQPENWQQKLPYNIRHMDEPTDAAQTIN